MMNLRQIYYELPPNWRLIIRRLYYLPVDIWETLMNRRHPLQPPKGKVFTGGGDYLKSGQEFMSYFIDYGQLKPHHRVLDIGSGMGRMALPLTEYLSKEGSYEGFDIMESAVNWCQKKFTPNFPNFRFKYIALENDLYRKEGGKAKNFVFPYSDDEFDFIFLTSVFTHLLPATVENYLAEIKRVLKKEGYCLATFFVINEASTSNMQRNSSFNFPYQYDNYWLMDEKVKSANVAFDEAYLEEILTKNGLQKVKQINGFWSNGIKKDNSFQDIIVFKIK